jgi:hypothetical protein
MTAKVTEIFPWQDAYSVGIPEIDAQHKQLIRLINDLHAAMLQGKGAAALDRVLSELVRSPAKQVVELRQRFQSGTNHIMSRDGQYARELA